MRDFVMGNSCYMVVTVLLVVGTERTRALRDSCDKCEAGTFCKKDNPVCTSCPPSTYSIRGGQPYCNICKVCVGYFRLKKPCSSTSDAECECTEGLHCLGPKCARCEKDCKPGQELTEQGCKNCGFGTFNDQNGGGSCRLWTNCSLVGKSVLENGTKEKDVVCGPTLASLSPVTSPPTAVPAPGEKTRRAPLAGPYRVPGADLGHTAVPALHHSLARGGQMERQEIPLHIQATI
ncbi:tumor necrosis factor receptor superfamily member 9 isoform X2 [Peromyscus californicus insignis]|uniref:tumor necrosis factor receptor superfamily member 9 isoform X2 n=1 Tax=Peromyscus californicus insignis TaxID=564181 RepID=UPI0022A7850E|nr:tumor necrosis factor receptor superfamily member 9 isoform X2 [Peromyscus californicus insignis]